MSDSDLILLDPARIKTITVLFYDTEPRKHGIIQVEKSIRDDGTVRFQKNIKTTDLFGQNYPNIKDISWEDVEYARQHFHFYEERGASSANLYVTGLAYSQWRLNKAWRNLAPDGEIYEMFLYRRTFFSILAYVPRLYAGEAVW